MDFKITQSLSQLIITINGSQTLIHIWKSYWRIEKRVFSIISSSNSLLIKNLKNWLQPMYSSWTIFLISISKIYYAAIRHVEAVKDFVFWKWIILRIVIVSLGIYVNNHAKELMNVKWEKTFALDYMGMKISIDVEKEITNAIKYVKNLIANVNVRMILAMIQLFLTIAATSILVILNVKISHAWGLANLIVRLNMTRINVEKRNAFISACSARDNASFLIIFIRKSLI